MKIKHQMQKNSLKVARKMWEKTVTSNTSISNLENFNLENESGELKVSRELKDGMTQYQLGNWKMDWLNTG